ncbi:MAG: cell division protein SepF, partial [Microthrixaceae bacterium]|nr:cell division protein SepF [Microthrixaceae bacterium]
MSNFMKNARSWLGLGQDPYYDAEYADPPLDDEWEDDVDDEEVVDVYPTAAAPRSRPAAAPRRSANGGAGTVRSVPTPAADEGDGDGGVRVISSAPGSDADSGRGVVRPLPGVSRPHVVNPAGFNDVQEVADTFKRNQPVILNLQ